MRQNVHIVALFTKSVTHISAINTLAWKLLETAFYLRLLLCLKIYVVNIKKEEKDGKTITIVLLKKGKKIYIYNIIFVNVFYHVNR